MLTEEEIAENKVRYVELLTHLEVDVSRFVKYLESSRVDFFNKPFTVYKGGDYAGSLCKHSLNAYAEIKKLCEIYCPNVYSEKEIIKVALLKDIYKAELYEKFSKNVKNEETGKWETAEAYRIKEERPVFGEVGFSSYMIAKKFFEFEDDEIVEAIVNSRNEGIDGHNIRQTYKLVPITQMAETAVDYFYGE